MKKYFLFFLMATFATFTMSCENETVDGTEDNEIAVDDDDSKGEDKFSPLEVTPQEFVDKASAGNMFEVQAAEYVLGITQSAQVKELATLLKNEHQKTQDELKGIATAKNYTVPANMPDDVKGDLDKLKEKTGAELDKEYVDMLEKHHDNDINFFERASKELDDAELKSFADKTLPHLRTHLDKVKTVKEQIKDNENKQS